MPEDNFEVIIQTLQRTNIEINLAYEATIEGFARALELREGEPFGHTRQVAEITTLFARAVGMPEDTLPHLRRGAFLHDIGKLGIPESILHKAGTLTDNEWAVMRTHPQIGYDLLLPIIYLHASLDIPYCHHEKWDGTGYPQGLADEKIPLMARIFSVVDVWDALISDRPFRKAWTDEQASHYLRQQAGTRFDPKLVDIFLHTEFKKKVTRLLVK